MAFLNGSTTNADVYVNFCQKQVPRYANELHYLWSYQAEFHKIFTRCSHIISAVNAHIYKLIHNYRNPYEKWNISVSWPHLWLKLGMVTPEIMLCEMVLNLSMLRYVTAQYPVT